MVFRVVFLTLIFSVFGCSSNTSKIELVANSFHEKYLDDSGNETFHIQVIEGEDGKCKLDFDSYRASLRNLKTISEKFINKEWERIKECENYIKTINWSDFKNSDGYQFIDSCSFLYYSFWGAGHEKVSGAEVVRIKKEDTFYNAFLKFYDVDDNEKIYWPKETFKIKIEKENNKWLITEIQKI